VTSSILILYININIDINITINININIDTFNNETDAFQSISTYIIKRSDQLAGYFKNDEAISTSEKSEGDLNGLPQFYEKLYDVELNKEQQ